MEPHPDRHSFECYFDGVASRLITDEIEQHLVYCSACARFVAETVRQRVQDLQRKRARAIGTLE